MSLFGNLNQLTPPFGNQQSTGIFGQSASQGLSSNTAQGPLSFFSNANNTNPFPNWNQNQTQPNLFSNPNNTSSLFSTQTNQGSNLLNANNSTTSNNNFVGNLFQSPLNIPNSSVSMTHSGPLFNQQSNIVGNQTNSTDLFGNPTSGTNLFGNKTTSDSFGANFNKSFFGDNFKSSNSTYQPVRIDNDLFMSITASLVYGQFSFEELRSNDYNLRKKQSQNENIFRSSTSIFTTSNSTSSLFGQPSQSSSQSLQSPNFFNNKTATHSNIFPASCNTNSSNIFNTNNNSNSLFGNANQGNNLFDLPKNNSNQLGGLFSTLPPQQPTSLFSTVQSQPQTQQQHYSSLFSNQQQQPFSLFNNTPQQPTQPPQGFALFPNTQEKQLFQPPQQPQQSFSLFPNPQPQVPLFSNTLQSQSQPQMSLFSNPPQPQPHLQSQPQQQAFSLFSSNQPQTQSQIPSAMNVSYVPYPTIPLYHPLFTSDPINNYIFNTNKTKTLSQILNELQAQYNDNNQKEVQQEEEKNELAYDNFMNNRLSEFKEFLKFKRNSDSSKDPRNKKLNDEPKSESKNKHIFDPINRDFFYQSQAAPSLKGKSHSCDMSKAQEKTILTNLAKSFDQTLLFNDPSLTRKCSDISVFLNLKIQILEPFRVSFAMKISRNAKFKALKNSIAETLKEKNKKYKHLTFDSFILMKKYSIIKEVALIEESGLIEGDVLFVILKESIAQNESELSSSGISMSINESTSKKRHNNSSIKKNELAPIDKLPQLTKPGYKTLPDMKSIFRLSLRELEMVEAFEIYNEHGKISFNEPCDLTSMNLDHIVTIDPGDIRLYAGDKRDSLPPIGSGLNKKATIYLNNITEDKSMNESDEIKEKLTLDYQLKRCKELNGVFKGYNNLKEEFIYSVEHF